MPHLEVAADLSQQIREAIASEGLWRSRILQDLDAGKASLIVGNVRHDDQCEVGAWLQGDPLAPLRTSPLYLKVVELHADVHRAALELIERGLPGRPDAPPEDEAARRDALRSFNAAGTALTRGLMAWKMDLGAAG